MIHFGKHFSLTDTEENVSQETITIDSINESLYSQYNRTANRQRDRSMASGESVQIKMN